MKFSSWFIFQRGKAYYVSGKYRDGDRWRQKAHKLDAKNKTDAKREGQDWITEQESVVEAQGSSSPFPEYAEAYLDMVRTTRSVEDSTIDSKQASLIHIYRGFDGVALNELTHRMAQEWVTSMAEDGMAPSTVRKAYQLASQVYRSAVRTGDATSNPFDDVELPKNAKNPPNALDSEGRARLVRLVEEQDETRLTLSIVIALYTGMREAEICALHWADVLFDENRIWVRRSILRGQGQMRDKLTKKDKWRDVPMTATVVDHLTRWRERYVAECGRLGVRFDPIRMYVTGRPDGTFYNPVGLSRDWRTLSRTMGFVGIMGKPCTFHDLRHTFATAAIAAGVDVKTVSSILGHANAAMTLNIYASADPEAKRNAAPAIDQAVMAR